MDVSEGERSHGRTLVRATEDVPVQARGSYWREALGGPFPGLAVDWLTDQPIRARLAIWPFAGTHVAEIRNTPAKVTYTPPTAAPRGVFQLVLQMAGTGCYWHAGREVVQEPGDVVLLDADLPFDSIFPSGLQVLVWSLPREALAPLLAAPENAVARRISGDHGLGAVLAGYARMLASEAARLDASAQGNLLLQLCNLAALTLDARPAAPKSPHIGYRAALRHRILAYIETHLRDGDLTAARVARDLKISRRWLHALFDEAETSFAASVSRRRVEECRRLLEDPAHRHLSIAEIAFQCGFNELSTFNRRFRARYAMAPRDVRRGRADSVS